MDKKIKKDELQSRREFFKSAAKGALPILCFSLFGPSILSSCMKEEEEDENTGCNGCSGGCSNSCSGSCSGGCSGTCDGFCDNTCDGLCDVGCSKYMH